MFLPQHMLDFKQKTVCFPIYIIHIYIYIQSYINIIVYISSFHELNILNKFLPLRTPKWLVNRCSSRPKMVAHSFWSITRFGYIGRQILKTSNMFQFYRRTQLEHQKNPNGGVQSVSLRTWKSRTQHLEHQHIKHAFWRGKDDLMF